MTNWLTLEETAQYLKIGKSTLYELARNGKVPAHKMGRVWRFDPKELDKWLKSGEAPLAKVVKQDEKHAG